jgi:hypothetical protein
VSLINATGGMFFFNFRNRCLDLLSVKAYL